MESSGTLSNVRVISAFSWFSNSRRGVISPGKNGSYPALMGKPARCGLRIALNVSQPANAATLPRYAGFWFNHSRTVTFGFGIGSFDVTRGSAKPVSASLYPGYERLNVLV